MSTANHYVVDPCTKIVRNGELGKKRALVIAIEMMTQFGANEGTHPFV